MFVQIGKLKESALDWAAAKAMGVEVTLCMPNKYPHVLRVTSNVSTNWSPSCDVYQCYCIIDAKKISTIYHPKMELREGVIGAWAAFTDKFSAFGEDRAQAVLRALVGKHFGKGVNVPDELVCREDLCD